MSYFPTPSDALRANKVWDYLMMMSIIDYYNDVMMGKAAPVTHLIAAETCMHGNTTTKRLEQSNNLWRIRVPASICHTYVGCRRRCVVAE